MEFRGLDKDGGQGHRNVDERIGGIGRRWNGRELQIPADKSTYTTRFISFSHCHPCNRKNNDYINFTGWKRLKY